jgi:hypothetical protein
MLIELTEHRNARAEAKKQALEEIGTENNND